MAKHFGMLFQRGDQCVIGWKDLEAMSPLRWDSPFHIHPDSLSSLEPHMGDYVMPEQDVYGFVSDIYWWHGADQKKYRKPSKKRAWLHKSYDITQAGEDEPIDDVYDFEIGSIIITRDCLILDLEWLTEFASTLADSSGVMSRSRTPAT